MTQIDWYYDYYEPGTFPHQKDLCDAVTRTPYNLEGRVATKTSLSPSSGNPLTIRLLAVRESLTELTNYVSGLDAEIKAHSKKQFETKKYSGLLSTYYGKGDLNDTGGAPMEIIKLDGEKREIPVKYIVIQSALYKFFTNYGSVMDRLAIEIELLYGLEEHKIDWTKLIDKRRKHDRVWKKLFNKDSHLALYIEKYRSIFEKAYYYRNRLIHIGLVDFTVNYHDPDNNYPGFFMILGTKSNNSTYNDDALKLCTSIKKDLLELLDSSYEMMICYYKSLSEPSEV